MKKKILFSLGIILIITVVIVLAVYKNNKNGLPLSPDASLGSAAALLAEAKSLEAKGELSGAKEAHQKLVNQFANSGEIMNWQKKIEDLNIKLLFSAAITPESTFYTVKPADTLAKIAREYRTTIELILKSNNLSSDRIIPGRKIKICNVPFTILVDKSQNVLLLKAKEEIFKTYTVSTGKNNCTPVGNFKIANKLINPTWFKSGAVIPPNSPENVLGTRWLGFDLPGYGIHGTNEPQNLGKQVTEGCVRMQSSEVEELYIIIPIGTEVTIVN